MRFVFFIVVAVVAIVAGVFALNLSGGQPPAPQPIKTQIIEEAQIQTVDVLVAKTNISVGTIIDATMVDTQPWPENLLVNGFMYGNQPEASVIGKVARSSIQAHEPFIKSKLANPNDPGFLAANLPTGMRAVTIAVDTVSGIAGFVFPGDRVDLVFTHGIAMQDGKLASQGIDKSEVIASNVKVLAINLRGSDAPVSDGGGSSKPAPVASPSSITVEVSDTIAQELRLAEKNGTISLSLRSIHDDNNKVPPPTTIMELTKTTDDSSATKRGVSDILIIRGPNSPSGKITSSSGLNDSSPTSAPKSPTSTIDGAQIEGASSNGMNVVK